MSGARFGLLLGGHGSERFAQHPVKGDSSDNVWNLSHGFLFLGISRWMNSEIANRIS